MSLQRSSSYPDSKLKPLKAEQSFKNIPHGRALPQAVDIEEIVLGAIMIDRDAFTRVLNDLKPESFYKPAHGIIYSTMEDLFEHSQPIDHFTLKDALHKNDQLEQIGGLSYLTYLSRRVGSAANVEYHARIVAQKFILRELIRISGDTLQDAFEDQKDVFEVLDEAEQNLFDITQTNLNRSYESIAALSMKVEEFARKQSEKADGVTGVPSGFSDLDKITAGWQPSDLVIVAGRPGMGKTSFALSLALHAARDFEKPVAIFSLEMAKLQLVQRMVAMESDITLKNLRDGTLKDYEWEVLDKAIEKMQEIPIFIDDTPQINIFELRAKCRRLKMQHDIDLIVVDYLQLMTSGSNNKSGSREQEISSISRALKSMAKDLNVPVMALSQLNRSTETRGGSKRPQLSDLRESGAIEQDADMVMFVYRPDYYELDEEVPKGQTEIIISKHRNGPTDTVNLNFVHEFTRFEELPKTKFEDVYPDFGGEDNDDEFFTRDSSMNDLEL